MIKISKSSMHEQKVVTFFSGDNLIKNSQYMFEESLPIFAEENLGPNLVEYYKPLDSNLDLLKNPEIKKLIDEVEPRSPRRIDIVDMHLSNLSDGYNLKIEYSDQFFDSISIDTLRHPFEHIGHFKVDFQLGDSVDSGRIVGIDKDRMSYIRVTISRDFLKENHTRLSEHLHAYFSPKRYVDTQVAFFLLMTSLSGISGAKERIK